MDMFGFQLEELRWPVLISIVVFQPFNSTKINIQNFDFAKI